MNRISEVRRRLANLRYRDRFDGDLEEEMQAHLEAQAQEHRANGMPDDAARLEARRQFGNSTALKETSREAWGWRALDELVRDFRLALRTLRRGPGFAAVAVITLALGIGLNMAVFALVYKVVLRPVNYRDVNRLMDVHLILTEERRGTIPMTWSYPKFQELVEWNRSFDAVAAEQAYVLTIRGIDEPLTTEVVSARYFRMTGVSARMGRIFADEEDRPAGPHSAMLISDGFWRSYFAADPGVIGRSMTVSGISFSIVGVMPPGFKGETGRTEAWAPMAAYLAISPNPSRGAHNLEAIGHLRPGVSPRQADEDVRQLVARMERLYPTDPTGQTKWAGGARPLLEARVDPQVRKALWILQAATACVLLIACVNLANLLLGRGAARRRELAIRLALGTSRGALMRQLLVEPVMLAVAARRFFPGANPLGRRIDYPEMRRNPTGALGEVIGVVADVRYGAPGAKTGPVVYASTLQTRPGAFLEVRAARDPRPLVPALRQIAHALDPEVRVYDVRTMDQLIALATWRARLAAVLLGLMAALSLAIAAVGVYGVFSYAVAARSREIGVRIALGAGRERILGMVLREGAVLSAAALAVGLPAAWMLTRTLSSQLYRVSPADPLVYLSVAAVLLGVAPLACYVPARRATRIDPMATLRSE